MNCDDFLPALETGGPVRRRRARRHAATCPRCAAVAARFAEVKRRWAAAAAEPATERDRRVWEQAAEPMTGRHEDDIASPFVLPLPRRRGVPWPLAAGLAAAACVLIVVGVIVRHHPDDVVIKPPLPTPPPVPAQPIVVAGPVRVTPVDAAGVLAGLSGDVDQLEQQVRDLRRQAERAAAREQVAMVLARFERP